MRSGRFYSVLLLWLAFAPLAFSVPVLAASDDLIETPEFFTVTIAGRLVRLEGLTVKRADAAGRMPVALITHGKPPTRGRMREQHASDLAPQARDLAERGWLAVAVMRRGFGASDGPMPAPVTCGSRSLVKRFDADADDLQATLERIAKRPDADPTRMIAIGASAGGVAVTALAARNPKGLTAVVSISGGLHFDNCDKDDALVAAIRSYGAKSRVPSLWVYADNDRLFGPAIVARMHAAFLEAGGDVKLIALPPIGRNGHTIFDSARGRDRWLPELDSFLRFHKLPTWPAQDVDRLARKLKSNEKYLGFLEDYVSAPSTKALAESRTSGALGRAFGFTSMAEARASAIALCQTDAGADETCDVVMENNVWVGDGAIASSKPVNIAQRPQTATRD